MVRAALKCVNLDTNEDRPTQCSAWVRRDAAGACDRRIGAPLSNVQVDVRAENDGCNPGNAGKSPQRALLPGGKRE
jgi:hypothetical protein